MDIRKVKKLIELMDESSVGELEIREGEEYVRIARNSPVAMGPAQQIYAPPPPTAAPAEPEAAAEPEPEEEGNVIRSPIVGTFYRASSPGARPFVDVGSTVSEGETVCIIEALKILNQIEADCSGVVREVLVENGAPVEYGQALMIIR